MSPGIPCECREAHMVRRAVLTGGPGAGKTAVLELIRQAFCKHVVVLPEAAGIVFGGGFPRSDEPAVVTAGQRAIFHVQHELEAAATASNPAVVLCDRGTLDGLAYWPGPGDLWAEVGTTAEAELARYAAVIHLRVPGRAGGYNRDNPLRIESADEARAVDERILQAWAAHPHVTVIEPTTDFMVKARAALEAVRRVLPPCCRRHELADRP